MRAEEGETDVLCAINPTNDGYYIIIPCDGDGPVYTVYIFTVTVTVLFSQLIESFG